MVVAQAFPNGLAVLIPSSLSKDRAPMSSTLFSAPVRLHLRKLAHNVKGGHLEFHCPYSRLGVKGQPGGTLMLRRCLVAHPQGCSDWTPTAP